MVKEITEEIKAQVIDLMFDFEEIAELEQSGKATVGHSSSRGYRQELLAHAIEKLRKSLWH